MIKNKNRGAFTDRQHKGVGEGRGRRKSVLYFSFLRSALVLARSPMFSKITKRKITQRLCTGYNRPVKLLLLVFKMEVSVIYKTIS